MSESIRIALAVRHEPARHALEKAVSRIPGASLQREPQASDILIYEVTPESEQDFLRLGRTLTSQTRGEVFLTCAEPSPDFLIQAMRAGIHEFLPLPVPEQELVRAVKRFQARQGAPVEPRECAGGRVRLVLGAKAGTGVTTLAVNLACALHARGERTVLVDLGRSMGEIPLFLDMEYAYTWGDAIQNLDRVDTTYLDSLLARSENGPAVLASPGHALPPSLAADPAALSQGLGRILQELALGFDQVVVDGGAHLDRLLPSVPEAADRVLLVMNPSLPCLARAKQQLDTLRKGQAEQKTHVISARHPRHGDIGSREMEEILQKRVFALLPDDYAAALGAMNQGRPLLQAAPKSALTRAIQKLAAGFSRRSAPTSAPGRSLLGLLRRKSAKQADPSVSGRLGVSS